MKRLLVILLGAAPAIALAQPSAAPDAGPPPADERAQDDFRWRERVEPLRRDPREDWRDQPWTGEAWRETPLRDRGAVRQSRSWRAARDFDAGPYRPPAGVRMHSWTFGQTLPASLRAAPYILTDYGRFHLPTPPPGHDWVRVASDALLTRRSDGYVEQIAYGLFL
jgi:Ni/Co efflux regulator RcnB